jgi:hypothetical protein
MEPRSKATTKALMPGTSLGLVTPPPMPNPDQSCTGESLVGWRMSDEQSARNRCRASYEIGGGGVAMRQRLRCADASYNFDLQGTGASKALGLLISEGSRTLERNHQQDR